MRYCTSFLTILLLHTLSPPILSGVSDTLWKDTNHPIGVHISHDIYPNGGDRILYMIIYILQSRGHEIDIILHEDNSCKSINQLEQSVAYHRIDLNYSRVRLIHIQTPVYRMLPYTLQYKTFVSSGVSKIPAVDGHGSNLNIYICKFVIDSVKDSTDKHVRWARLRSLSTYDLMLVDSIHTYKSLSVSLREAHRELVMHRLTYPSVYVIPPPVIPLKVPASSNLRKSEVQVCIFVHSVSGTHSGSALFAIDLYKRLAPNKNIRLTLVLTAPMSVRAPILDSLKNIAQANVGVRILTSNDIVNNTHILGNVDFIWHIGTSVKRSKIHNTNILKDLFDSSVLDAMATGGVPIVSASGAHAEILSHGINGFVVSNATEFVKYAVKVVSLSPKELEPLRKAVKRRAEYFSVSRFTTSFERIYSIYLESQKYHAFTQTALSLLRRKKITPNTNTSHSAVIIAPFVSSSFEFAVKNTMYFLGPGWALHVFHSQESGDFVQFVLRNTHNVIFHQLELVHDEIYESLLKKKQFWLSLNAEKVLIFQSDTLFMTFGVDKFMNYDFVSGPDYEGDRGKCYVNVCPGNIFLCSVASAVEVCGRFRVQLGRSQESIEIAFSKYMSQLRYAIAPPEVSQQFCVEHPRNVSSLGINSLIESEQLVLQRTWQYLSPVTLIPFYKATAQKIINNPS